MELKAQGQGVKQYGSYSRNEGLHRATILQAPPSPPTGDFLHDMNNVYCVTEYSFKERTYTFSWAFVVHLLDFVDMYFVLGFY